MDESDEIVDDAEDRPMRDFHKLITAFMMETICTMSYFNRQGDPLKPIITGGLWIYQGEVEDDFQEEWFKWVCRTNGLDVSMVRDWIKKNKSSVAAFKGSYDISDRYAKGSSFRENRRRACAIST